MISQKILSAVEKSPKPHVIAVELDGIKAWIRKKQYPWEILPAGIDYDKKKKEHPCVIERF